ncbi:cadmium resistance transporter [Amycolatopsis pigmentata]|uniref:Cadmium resistance transporter n=1 Tax=Amycolatopsis pigmentata TaxID=450801 RepID=A0ABW5FUQ8_9PSEU
MTAPWTTIAQAAGVFACTNIDDLVVLTALFLAARARGVPRPREVVVGQYLGFAVLVAVSAGAAAGLVAVPGAWAGLLGLVPLALGVRGLWRARSADRDGADPVASGLLGVAAITIANGADNLSVYVPVFHALRAGQVLLTIAVFLVLLGLWCAAGAALGGRPKIIAGLARVGPVLVPAVFIVIGVWILVAAGISAKVR